MRVEIGVEAGAKGLKACPSGCGITSPGRRRKDRDSVGCLPLHVLSYTYHEFVTVMIDCVRNQIRVLVTGS